MLVVKLPGISRLITAILICGIAMSSYAVDKSYFNSDKISKDLDEALDKDAAEIQLGSVKAYPGIAVGIRHDDNLFSSDTDEKSTLIGIVAPAVKFALEDNIKKLTLVYGIEAGFHEDSSPDDYTDQKLLGIFAFNPTDRIKTELRAEYLDEHDPRGTARTEGGTGSAEPDEWHSYGLGGLFRFGAPNATGRVEIDAAYIEKEYDNNRSLTSVRDRNDLRLRGTFFYRIRPKTQLLFEVKQTDYEYEKTAIGTPTLDSTNRDYLFGVTWDATYKTTGFIKVGYLEKDFDSDIRNDTGDFKWEIGARWRPRSYSTVNFSTERRQDETNGIGDSIDVGEFEVSWNHEWRDRISSTVGFLYGEDDYNSTIREDDRYRMGINLNYHWRRWARISAGYHYEERDSNVDTFDYERNLFDLTVNLTL